ncbi:hypothetical protein BKA93DRAFT_811708 [Sparassis latifolia]
MTLTSLSLHSVIRHLFSVASSDPSTNSISRINIYILPGENVNTHTFPRVSSESLTWSCPPTRPSSGCLAALICTPLTGPPGLFYRFDK